VWPNVPPLTYHLNLQVSLKHHHHIDNHSSRHLIHQTLSMRLSLVPKHYPPPLQHSTTVSSASSYPSAEPSPNVQNDWDSIQTSPQIDIPEEYALAGQPMDTATSPMAQEFPARPPAEADAVQNAEPYDVSASTSKLHKTPSIPLRKQRWPVLGGMFGHSDKSHLPPVNESRNQSNTSLNERSPRAQIAVRYQRCHLLSPQRLHRRIPRR
jgi:hypothetical protein